MPNSEHERTVENIGLLVKKLDAVGWGLFLIWMGISFLADVGWGVGLLGVGMIAIGAQVARKYFGLPVEQFGLVIGIIFVIWGVWELLKIQIGKVAIPSSLLPILFIGAGIVLVVSALLRKPRQ